jgi:hypothetical protein
LVIAVNIRPTAYIKGIIYGSGILGAITILIIIITDSNYNDSYDPINKILKCISLLYILLFYINYK